MIVKLDNRITRIKVYGIDTNPTWTDLGSNTDIRVEGQPYNDWSHGTTFNRISFY